MNTPLFKTLWKVYENVVITSYSKFILTLLLTLVTEVAFCDPQECPSSNEKWTELEVMLSEMANFSGTLKSFASRIGDSVQLYS